MKQKLVLVISVITGLLAALLTHQFIQARLDRMEKEKAAFRASMEQIEVVVAGRDLPQGTVLTRSDLRRQTQYTIASRARGPVVTVDEAELLLNRKTLFHIAAGETISWRDIEGGSIRERGLSAIVSTEMRALSLAIGGAAAVSSTVAKTSPDRIRSRLPCKIRDGILRSVLRFGKSRPGSR